MKHHAGLDVSVKETSVCIVDETGTICREIKVVSHPEDRLRVLQDAAWHLERIGLEAGPLSQWLFEGSASAGLPVVCIETRHTKAFLKAQVNKTDRQDARGIAQMMRGNLFRPVHVKTLSSQKRRALLTATPARFRRSKAVGPALGLTPVLHQSGESSRVGRISLCGDAMMRTLLFEAAQIILTRPRRWSWLKAWAMKVAQRRGRGKAVIALARRLAPILHRIWCDGTEFRWTRQAQAM
jgi:transposase